MTVNSSLQITPESGGIPTTFTTEPSFYGAYSGVQMKLRIGKILLNPYIVNLITFNDTCQKVKVSSGGTLSAVVLKCRNGGDGFDLPSGFIGFGLFAGYGPFRFNVLARNLSGDPSFNIKNYAASWAFDF